MRGLLPVCALVACMLSSCGGSPSAASREPEHPGRKSVRARPAQADQEQGEPSASEAPALPTECASSGELCLPPDSFVKRLCADAFPGVALYLFRRGSPWTRGYLTRKTQAVNASGGKSGEGYLEFDEEVLALRKRVADYGGMQVSGAMGGWDVLRWDGTCATLAAEELTLNLPPAPKAAKVVFRFLDENIKEALRKDPKVDEVYLAHRKECKGATMGEVSKKCEELDKKLSAVIVQAVRSGVELPTPERLP